ncbi:MAG: TatD family hydrolase [Bacteroidales bacterium]|nr:TatD family hydrolase [Bacteroidales bacterium]
MTPAYIDTHCHITDEAFAGCEEDIIARARAAGVYRMLQADISSAERPAMFARCAAHPGVLFPMLGLYPGAVGKDWRDEIDAMLPWRDKGIVAIGEIGLDYHYGKDSRSEQLEAFRTQLELAASWNLPVNIHLREATEDFLQVMEDCRHLHLRGNLHAFGGDAGFVRRMQRYGDWLVGIGGVATFKNARVGAAVRDIPMDRILLETDAPYLTPVPHRGERNESAYLPLIAAFIARQKETSLEEVAEETTKNALKLFF